MRGDSRDGQLDAAGLPFSPLGIFEDNSGDTKRTTERIFGTVQFSRLTNDNRHVFCWRTEIAKNFWWRFGWNVNLSMIPKSKSGFPPIFAFVTQIPFFHPQRLETGGRIIPFKVAAAMNSRTRSFSFFGRGKGGKMGRERMKLLRVNSRVGNTVWPKIPRTQR